MKTVTTAMLTLAALLARAAPAAAQAKRPNFLFVFTDDQRWDALGVVQREQGAKGRFPWLKTPNLDRLAAQGARFRNAFVVNSLCAPSRATFLTGCYGHVNGVVNNHTEFPRDNVTFATLLRAAGYVTGYVGKWHMGRQGGPRPGFDFSASFLGQGKYFDCPVEVNGRTVETRGWVDDVSTDYALRFLRENRQKSFALVLAFKAAHGPFTPPERHAETYAGAKARAVPNLGAGAIYKKGGKAAADPPAEVPTNLGYFRCLSAVDDNVGRLLRELDELGLSEDTVVIFSSDNGFYLGEHGLGDKRSAYEESLRIPMLLRYPRLVRPGRVIDELVLNIDVAPTLLDLAGVPVPQAMQGRSWRPLLEGKATDWRRAFFYCYFYERNFTTPTVTAVRTEDAVLIRYPGHDDWTEVFDLKADPYQLHNLANDKQHAALRRELEAEYDRQAKKIDFRIPPFADDPAKDRPREPLQAWVLDFSFDKDAGDKVVDGSGRGNHGVAKGAPLRPGQEGGAARAFDGQGYIEVGKSASLNPAVAGWTVEVTLKADKATGMILARGGKSNGYSLHLDAGRPVFTVVAKNKAARVRGPEAVTGRWVRITAQITADRQLRLSVDGKPVAQAKLHAFIPQDPNDVMQIGTDLGSPVQGDAAVPPFVGLIGRVRLFSGVP